MRNSYIILAIIILSMSMFSCTTSDLAEEIAIEELATEGEEGEIPPDDEDGDESKTLPNTTKDK